MAKLRSGADAKHSGGASSGGRENAITKGGIETAVEGFHGNITTQAPFKPTYGTHKKPGSEMAPVLKGGRGGAKQSMRGKLNKASFD